MVEFTLTIPGNPPALNDTYRVVIVRGARRLAKKPEVSAWQDHVAYRAREAKPSGWVASRRVYVEVRWWTARKRDADAGLKALLDALATGLGIDDSCFLPSVTLNEIDKEDPRTIVTIRCEP